MLKFQYKIFIVTCLVAIFAAAKSPLFAQTVAAEKSSDRVVEETAGKSVENIPELPIIDKQRPWETINDHKRPNALGGMISTLGVGAEYQYGLPLPGEFFNHIGLRGGINYMAFDLNQSLGEGNEITFGMNLVTPEFMVDLYPGAGSGFHFTVGAMWPIGGVEGKFKTGNLIKINGNEFGNLSASMKVNVSSLPVVPYFGVGIKSWSGARAASYNWIGSNIDLGFIWIEPSAEGTLECGNCSLTYSIAGKAIPIADLRKQFNETLVDKANSLVKNIPLYPVLRWDSIGTFFSLIVPDTQTPTCASHPRLAVGVFFC